MARFWHDSWHLAHAGLVPDALTRLRTLSEFAARLPEFGDTLRVAGPAGAPLGLCVVKDDLLAQIYVSRQAMGSGLARALLIDGEARIRAQRYRRARLHCVVQNHRAIRFYTRMGWQEAGRDMAHLETSAGVFDLETLLFEKHLTADTSNA